MLDPMVRMCLLYKKSPNCLPKWLPFSIPASYVAPYSHQHYFILYFLIKLNQVHSYGKRSLNRGKVYAVKTKSSSHPKSLRPRLPVSFPRGQYCGQFLVSPSRDNINIHICVFVYIPPFFNHKREHVIYIVPYMYFLIYFYL